MDNIAQYKVYENQSWLDISNVLYGSPEHAYRLAQENHSSITDDIKSGTIIFYSTDIQSNKLVLLSMNSYRSIPATAFSQNREDIIAVQGVGHWSVGYEFKIS